MTREVSRRLSYDPVLKGARRPDITHIIAPPAIPADQMSERRHRPRVLGPRQPNGENI